MRVPGGASTSMSCIAVARPRQPINSPVRNSATKVHTIRFMLAIYFYKYDDVANGFLRFTFVMAITDKQQLRGTSRVYNIKLMCIRKTLQDTYLSLVAVSYGHGVLFVVRRNCRAEQSELHSAVCDQLYTVLQAH